MLDAAVMDGAGVGGSETSLDTTLDRAPPPAPAPAPAAPAAAVALPPPRMVRPAVKPSAVVEAVRVTALLAWEEAD